MSAQVVISFRWTGDHINPDAIEQLFRSVLTPNYWIEGLTVAVREPGASGETVTDEGRWERDP
jgi:hypothetical protein